MHTRPYLHTYRRRSSSHAAAIAGRYFKSFLYRRRFDRAQPRACGEPYLSVPEYLHTHLPVGLYRVAGTFLLPPTYLPLSVKSAIASLSLRFMLIPFPRPSPAVVRWLKGGTEQPVVREQMAGLLLEGK